MSPLPALPDDVAADLKKILGEMVDGHAGLPGVVFHEQPEFGRLPSGLQAAVNALSQQLFIARPALDATATNS